MGEAAAREEYVVAVNGSAGAVDGSDYSDNDKLDELKKCLVDNVYGTDLGFRASSEVRAEVFELVSQLEAVNLIPVPTDVVEELDGIWVLLNESSSYVTAFPLAADASNCVVFMVLE